MQMAEKYSAKHSDKYLIKPPRRAVSYITDSFCSLLFPVPSWMWDKQGRNPEMIEYKSWDGGILQCAAYANSINSAACRW
jgi:hypothetical protein